MMPASVLNLLFTLSGFVLEKSLSTSLEVLGISG
jgi:hypothetical protein